MSPSAKVGNVGQGDRLGAGSDPAIDIEKKLFERIGKSFGVSAWIVADRRGGRSQQGRVALQQLVRAMARADPEAIGRFAVPENGPSVAAISIVRRFFRPAVTWET